MRIPLRRAGTQSAPDLPAWTTVVVEQANAQAGLCRNRGRSYAAGASAHYCDID
jgi:hypothetical protein